MDDIKENIVRYIKKNNMNCDTCMYCSKEYLKPHGKRKIEITYNCDVHQQCFNKNFYCIDYKINPYNSPRLN